jgi:hypothetical protein
MLLYCCVYMSLIMVKVWCTYALHHIAEKQPKISLSLSLSGCDMIMAIITVCAWDGLCESPKQYWCMHKYQIMMWFWAEADVWVITMWMYKTESWFELSQIIWCMEVCDLIAMYDQWVKLWLQNVRRSICDCAFVLAVCKYYGGPWVWGLSERIIYLILWTRGSWMTCVWMRKAGMAYVCSCMAESMYGWKYVWLKVCMAESMHHCYDK